MSILPPELSRELRAYKTVKAKAVFGRTAACNRPGVWRLAHAKQLEDGLFPGCLGVAVTLPLTIVLGGKNPTLHLHAVPLGCHSLVTSGSQAGRYPPRHKQRQESRKRKTSKSNTNAKSVPSQISRYIGSHKPASDVHNVFYLLSGQ